MSFIVFLVELCEYHQKFPLNNEQTLYISSEIKALFEGGINKTPNEKVWANYFAYGSYGLPHESFWQNVQQLVGGSYLQYRKGNVTIKKWYDFQLEIKKWPSNQSIEEAKAQYMQLLHESIQLRFRTDVPLGFNVSGGLDSSLLLSLVKTKCRRLILASRSFFLMAFSFLPEVITNSPLRN